MCHGGIIKVVDLSITLSFKLFNNEQTSTIKEETTFFKESILLRKITIKPINLTKSNLN
jgi:hypothetical protein